MGKVGNMLVYYLDEHGKLHRDVTLRTVECRRYEKQGTDIMYTNTYAKHPYIALKSSGAEPKAEYKEYIAYKLQQMVEERKLVDSKRSEVISSSCIRTGDIVEISLAGMKMINVIKSIDMDGISLVITYSYFGLNCDKICYADINSIRVVYYEELEEGIKNGSKFGYAEPNMLAKVKSALDSIGNTRKIKLWYLRYEPFRMGGSLEEPISTTLTVLESRIVKEKCFELLELYIPDCKKWMTFDVYSGAHCGGRVADVIDDIRSCENIEFMKKQVKDMKIKGESARKVSALKFFFR